MLFSENFGFTAENFTDNLTDARTGAILYRYKTSDHNRKAVMKDKIRQLKKEKNAVILAHYYTPDEVQEIADYIGDSFYLAKAVKQSTAERIVFCGVSFMGESAKILNPLKKVYMPDLTADCPMAHMASPEVIRQMRERYEDLAVVCYINSTAELKCHSDVCVTSSNAVKIVKALPNRNIFFIPDRNLGRHVAEQVPEKNIILNDGCCPIHAAVTAESILAEKAKYPGALVLSHPECEPEVLALSDYIGSTADILKFAKAGTAEEYIIGTEAGVAWQLRKDSPDKQFYFPSPCPCCIDMKRNTLENVLAVLEKEINEVHVSEDVIRMARIPLDRMLELAV